MAVSGTPDWVTERPRPRLASAVVELDRGPDRCTIYPVEAPESELVTNWITATGDSFVDLADAC
jgi:hypothetical protein